MILPERRKGYEVWVSNPAKMYHRERVEIWDNGWLYAYSLDDFGKISDEVYISPGRGPIVLPVE